MLRAIAERLSRGRSFRYRLPRMYGGCRMYLTPEAGLRYWLPRRALRVDENLLSSATEMVKPGDVVWDVGANMGLLTFAAAGVAGPNGHVFALEPDVVMVRLLRRSARLNPGSAPVEVISCAVSESVSLARFNIAMRSRSSNYLEGFGMSQTGGIRETETVLKVTLDWLADKIAMPDVVKIDVEGAELDVLRGAVRMLRACRPILIFELAAANWEKVSRLLAELNYTLYDSDQPASHRQPLSRPSYNVLAMPSPMHGVAGSAPGLNTFPEIPDRLDFQTARHRA
jgi:FkbM family methyltransferase